MKMDTILAQIGNTKENTYGAISVPINMSTTYRHPGLGQSTGYDYTRTKNPTREVLEQAVAKLESGTRGFAASSGMSAIRMVVSIFEAGSHFVASRDLYGGSYRYFKDMERKGIYEFSYAETEEDFEKLIKKNTKAIFVETPTNPLMKEVSIENLAKMAKRYQLKVIVDNTFYTPLIQRPLELGADIVVHSATKYLSGHNDVLAGIVVTNSEELGEKLFFEHNTTGATLSALDSWLVIRGLKTLALRMKRHEESAKKIVTYLEKEENVTQVFYSGRGGMISFKIKEEKIKQFLKALKIITFAESLGGVESLITYPTLQTHADIPQETREAYGLTSDLLRISVGIEDAEDLIEDLKHGFRSLEEK